MPELVRAEFQDSERKQLLVSVERRAPAGEAKPTWLVKVRSPASPEVVSVRTFPSISLALGYASEIFELGESPSSFSLPPNSSA